MRALALAGVLGIAAMAAGQGDDVTSELIEYQQGDTVLQGYMAWRPSTGTLPAVMIVHEWKGRGEYVKRRADQLARLGYLAFAADMYGKGVFAKDHEEAGKLAGAFFNDRKLMRERARAGLDVLVKHKMCDSKRVAAMGYCFGGTTVLEMARAGFDLKGVASFHGNLSTPTPADAKNIKGKVIAFHGADDTFVPKAVVDAFHKEMKDAKVDLSKTFNVKFVKKAAASM